MNIIFAYHNGDKELAMESAKAITAMGMNLRHKAFVCASNEASLIYEITKELEKSFQEVGRIMAQDGFDGWPLGPNQLFVDAAAFASQIQSSWYFWEPDCVPMKQGWIDELEEEYRRNPKIMGHIFDGGMAANGKTIYNMMVGSAVYPFDFLEFCPSARSLTNYNLAHKQQGVTPEPWDVRCRYNFLAIGRNTPLIRTYWNSVNYKKKDGKLTFFARDPESQAVQGVTCPDRTVDPRALVVHGCKDGSLHRMAQNGFIVPPLEDKISGLGSCEVVAEKKTPKPAKKKRGRPKKTERKAASGV